MKTFKDTHDNRVAKRPSKLKALYAGVVLSAISTLSFANTPVAGDDWLHVSGNQILDMNDNPVWLTGANWFGFNTSERVLHGLWSVNLEDTLQSIADRGINILRIPISTELLYEWQNGIDTTANVNTATNPDLVGATTLEIFDAMVDYSREIGLKIMLDAHSAKADNTGHIAPLWYDDTFTPEIFYSTWEWVTDRYKDDDTIIAMDIENEPHGKPYSDSEFAKWDTSTDDNNWKYTCETASNRILAINPNVLVMCEGIESFPVDGVTWTSTDEDDYYNNWWGGNLRGVRDLPIELANDEYQAQFMYSPHDYGPLVYEQAWFYEGFSKDTLYQDVWYDNWMFIHEEGISPLLIGEWGGFMDGGDNETWMLAIRDLIIEYGLHHTFWCINPNSGDTGGLLDNDWVTWDEEKYALFEPSLWKTDEGLYISLDHEVALGSSETGISLNDYLGTLSPSVTINSPDSGDYVLTGSEVEVSYRLTQSEAVNVYLDGTFVIQDAATGTVSVTAPTLEGDFVVELIGVDSDGVELSASDSITLSAVDEIPLQPEVSIVTPAADTSYEADSVIEVEVTLEDATGFQTTLDGVSNFFSGESGSITAPSVVGDYSLLVTALDDNMNALDATDSVDITVREPSVTEISCTVGAMNVWNSGFVISEITVENTGTESIDGWSVTLTFDDSVGYVSGWNGNFSVDAQTMTITNADYNGSLSSGASTSFGLQGSHEGSVSAPTCEAN